MHHNIVLNNSADYTAGGVYLWGRGAALYHNTIISNTAPRGGGLILYRDADTLLRGNTIMTNTGYRGGGILLDQSTNALLINNIIANNQVDYKGGGMYITASASRMLHNTIANNHGGDNTGIFVTNNELGYSNVVLTNTILASHNVGISVTLGSTATLESTLWYDNSTDWAGAGVINHYPDYAGNPVFVDAPARDYHLDYGSAAVDKGTMTEVTTDIDGETRPNGLLPDMGADELIYTAPTPTSTPSSTPSPTPTPTATTTPPDLSRL